MSRSIANYMNLEKSKRPTFWNGGSTWRVTIKAQPSPWYIFFMREREISIAPSFLKFIVLLINNTHPLLFLS